MDGFDARLEATRTSFEKRFNTNPIFYVRAPGRVNLIGDHTDYNKGYVLPCAIDREMLIAARPREDNQICVYSMNYDSYDQFSLRQLEKVTEQSKEWCNYLRGVAKILQTCEYSLNGFDAVLSGNVPQGAGLSSSAAFEVAVTILFNEMSRLSLDEKQIALLAQRAENEFVGVQCGIMDQLVSTVGQENSAILIDCLSLNWATIPLDLKQHGLSLVIINSGVRRELVTSEYNQRRAECLEGVRLLSELAERPLQSLREITLNEFLLYEKRLPEKIASRCKHVLSENGRVLAAQECLKEGDLEAFGQLMNDSHASLRDLFQVSCRELDVLVELTQGHPGVLGARMTGAGFGGCIVSIVEADNVDSIRESILPDYEMETGQKSAEVYICQPASGAGLAHSALPL